MGADRFGEANVRGDAFAEKCVRRPLTGAIVKLRRQDHIARRVFFLQAADRRHGNDPADVQGNGARRCWRDDSIRAAESDARGRVGAKNKPAGREFPAHDRIRRRAERRLDLVFRRIAESFIW